MSLRLADIGYAYAIGSASHVALYDARLDVAPGELVLVLGTTGSGKSTLLRIAAGLVRPDVGSALIDGAPLTSESARGRVGLVFQNAEAQLFDDTVTDDVAFGPRNLGAAPDEARAVAENALRRVGLDPQAFGHRSPFSLSGGEARRVAFAGVLAMEPAYLLADEPTAGLDASGRRSVRELIAEARRTAGVVVVSHSPDEFLAQADKVLLLSAGRCAWWGPAEALVQDPSPLGEAGLCPPPVLEVQLAARAAGLPLDRLHLDADDAAEALATAGGWL